ncbi:two-partner secretion domain-containing protein [Limnofasciculus baicalensis]|uniref:Filamentous hemagglutinin N-terminal domain-containing protein n=1 Tax=Limnofasciculus baicalensis BBK-W-15 TaxID=2699891 RepID=A0AAE3GVV9_9CYAN|nr:filamentous hemagglutinin N-terminal domain-containing protein [Limnofasciculus baicalensis]MCP2731605.1 filamentous hemagglutinin N-terminal domain-containing protein [Limnofasciculus baicalensis BBK-W-15]
MSKNQWLCSWIFCKKILAKSEVISWGIASLLTFYSHCALAQITPDGTLGGEASVVTHDINIKGLPGDLIEGGALRGSALFHSFSEFNVGEGERVYFGNPSGVENIFSRVTGADFSQILGTLGVLGNGNLFLLNPNGIIFGENAQLDVRGSFVASTADSFIFDNGLEFSATNPEVPPLLTVNVPIGLQFGGKPPAAISNGGNLQVGGDLTLVGGRVNSLGKLATPAGEVRVAAVNGDVQIQDLSGLSAILLASNNLILEESQLQTGGDLILLAGNTVRVRDSLQKPFLADAGGNLYIQGNQGIDILALNHPGTPFQSGGNLSLVSDGIISGDAHFASGGNFLISNLLGQPGNFVSLYDPIISSEGDVILGDYTGVALKIEAKGSITTGNITITGSDTILTPGSDPDIAILRSSPALILRAGVDKLENPPTPINIPTPPTPPTPPQPPTPPSAIAVYDNNFEDPTKVGSEWSNNSIDITPSGEKFLGEFVNDTVSFTLPNLNPHKEAMVSFDLFIIGLWDGNGNGNNPILSLKPETWKLSVAGNSTPLLQTTFSNHDANSLSQTRNDLRSNLPRQVFNFIDSLLTPLLVTQQSYPNNPSSARTGADRPDNSLGYQYQNTIPIPISCFLCPRSVSVSIKTGADSVYNFNFTFPHSDSSLKLNFSASGLENSPTTSAFERWGLDNIKVSLLGVSSPSSPIPPTPTPTPSTIPNFTSIDIPSGGTIAAGNIFTPGGPVILSARNDINMTGSITSQGGKISLNSGGTINTTAGTINASLPSGNGGTISINAANNIDLGNISSFGDTLGGNISIESDASIRLTNSQIFNSSNSGASGKISLIAESDIYLDDSQIFNSTISGKSSDINLTSRSVYLTNNSTVITQGLENGKAGNINVTASESVVLSGSSGLFSDNRGSQPTGNINVDTGQLIVQDGSTVSISTNSKDPNGGGGTLKVTAANSVLLSGTDPETSIPTTLFSLTLGAGDAGDIIIDTPSLTVLNGAAVVASTAPGSTGKGGNIIANTELIELIGTSANLVIPSGFSVDTIGTGKTGNMSINSNRIIARDGGTFSGSTFGKGEGGNLNLNALEYIELSGTSQDQRIRSGIYAASFDTGKAGNLRIETPVLTVRDSARVSVSSQPQRTGEGNLLDRTNALLDGLKNINQNSPSPFFEIPPVVRGEGVGDAGNIEITANRIFLNNRGQIIAETASGEGGNITLKVQEYLLMRHNSLISATAGKAPGGGNGGNITINTPFIIGISGENSDIAANAYFGNGGRVGITGEGIYGLQFRPELTIFSDITASSEFGFDGVVEINLPDISPSTELQEEQLPQPPEVSEVCQPGTAKTPVEFVNTGRGGKPPHPSDALNSNPGWRDSRSISSENNVSSMREIRQIVEVQGWVTNERGEVVELVANPPSFIPDGGSYFRFGCGYRGGR